MITQSLQLLTSLRIKMLLPFSCVHENVKGQVPEKNRRLLADKDGQPVYHCSLVIVLGNTEHKENISKLQPEL